MSAKPQGVLGIFEHADSVVDAIKALQSRGKKRFTVMTPVPNHEIAEAIDDTPSPVRLFTLLGGLIGGILGFTLCAWTSLDWPLVTNGKEILSIPPFMIITFECTVLIGGLTNLVAMLFFAGLPDLQQGEAFDSRFTEDRFGIWVPSGREDADHIAGVLRAAGAEEVRVDADKLALVVVLCVAGLSLGWATGLLSLPWTHDLDYQVSIKPQKMPLMPPDGVVPITGRIDDGDKAGADRLVSDVPADSTSLRRGKNAFNTYCTPCHGLSGEGNGTVAKHLPIPPINLTDAALQSGRSDGSIYYTIRHGSVIMPGYAYALTRERAWDVVHYVRTLKSQ